MDKIALLDSLERGDSVTITYNIGSELESSSIALFLGMGPRGYLFKDATGRFEFSSEFLLMEDNLKIEKVEEFD